MSENICKVSVRLDGPRTVLHSTLKLTGCELSVNNIPAGSAVPFVHSHQDNEELYLVLEGRGELYLDGEIIALQQGDAFKIAPAGKRAIRAAQDCPIRYICIQSKAGSLHQYTERDAVLEKEKAPWHP